jgi:hypothetical protein
MPVIDLDALLDAIRASMTEIVGKDVRLLRGYSAAKARAIARFTKLVGEGYAQGEIDEAELEAELEEIDRMTDRFVRNLRALARVTIERLVKAVTGHLYGAVRAAALAAGAPLPAIELPED